MTARPEVMPVLALMREREWVDEASLTRDAVDMGLELDVNGRIRGLRTLRRAGAAIEDIHSAEPRWMRTTKGTDLLCQYTARHRRTRRPARARSHQQ